MKHRFSRLVFLVVGISAVTAGTSFFLGYNTGFEKGKVALSDRSESPPEEVAPQAVPDIPVPKGLFGTTGTLMRVDRENRSFDLMISIDPGKPAIATIRVGENTIVARVDPLSPQPYQEVPFDYLEENQSVSVYSSKPFMLEQDKVTSDGPDEIRILVENSLI